MSLALLRARTCATRVPPASPPNSELTSAMATTATRKKAASGSARRSHVGRERPGRATGRRAEVGGVAASRRATEARTGGTAGGGGGGGGGGGPGRGGGGGGAGRRRGA